MERPKDSGTLPEQKTKQRQTSMPRELTNNVPPTNHKKLVNPPVTDHPRISMDVNPRDALSPEWIQALVEEEIETLKFEEDMLRTQVPSARKELTKEKEYQADLERFLKG